MLWYTMAATVQYMIYDMVLHGMVLDADIV